MPAHPNATSFPRGGITSGPVVAFALFGLMLLGSWSITHWSLPWPECGMRRFTGLPCPACGCTRSLLAWTQLDFTAAFLFNPLFFLLCVLSLISCAWQWLRRSRSRVGKAGPERPVPFPWLPWFTWRIAGVVLVLNWLYLCWSLPKH